MRKRTVHHQQAWVGCRRSRREGKKEWNVAIHFVDRLNKSIKARRSTLIELYKWDWGGTHGKAATKQQQGWADHGFRHFLKLITMLAPPRFSLSSHLSFCFSSACLALQLFFLPHCHDFVLLFCFVCCTCHKYHSLCTLFPIIPHHYSAFSLLSLFPPYPKTFSLTCGFACTDVSLKIRNVWDIISW